MNNKKYTYYLDKKIVKYKVNNIYIYFSIETYFS